MIKIQFGTHTGIDEVKEFDQDTEIIKREILYSCLNDRDCGKCGCVIDQKTYNRLNDEYGIQN